MIHVNTIGNRAEIGKPGGLKVDELMGYSAKVQHQQTIEQTK
jgi:hypothetical protein